MTKYLLQSGLRRGFWLLAGLWLLAAMAHGQVVGLQPTPMAGYQWNSTSNQWQQITTTDTANPSPNTPQAFAWYRWNASLGQWVPCLVGEDCSGGSAGAITALTGDVTATGPGSAAATLATVNSAPGTCGDATHVCQITTNGKGLTTSQTAVAITGGGSGTLNFIPLWTPNGTTLGNSHLDDGVTTANTITSSETVQSIVSGQDAIPFLAVNNGTSTLHVAAPQFICPNITTSTVSGCAFGIGISTANVDADRLSIEYRYGGSVAADRGALSMSTAVTDNQEALMWDWAGNVYLPQLPSETSLATDSTGKIIAGSISSGITQLTGDGAAGPGSGSQAFTLATVNASPGSCGDSTHVCQITTNAKGLTTSQTAVAISAGGGTVLCAPNAQTGTAYTLVLADGTASGSACIGTVTMNNAAANNVTVPPNSSVALPTPDEIDLIQLGAGQTCFVAGAGVTLTTPTSLCARAQDSTIGIRQISANTWIVFGDTQ